MSHVQPDFVVHATPLTKDSPSDDWEHWMRYAYRIASKVVWNASRAEEFADEAILLLWKEAANTPVEKPAAFILRCLQLQIVNAARAQGVAERNAPDLTSASSQGTTPEEAVASSEEIDLLETAIAKLPPRQKLSLLGHYYHDLSDKEIAAMECDVPSRMKTARFNALENLRKDKTIKPVR
jgi:RNA polymerase sigma factor (sigma-70 family)